MVIDVIDFVFESLSESMVRISQLNSLNEMKLLATKGKELIFSAENCDARKIIEQIKPKYIINPEYHSKGDHGHQLNSGIDLPTFRFMQKNDLIFCVDLGKLFLFLQSHRANPLLARIKQNLMLAKKAKVEVLFVQGSQKLSKSQYAAIKETFC